MHKKVEALDKQALLCIGLDSDIRRLPERFLAQKHPQFEFNRWIIDQTHQRAAAYKPNLAFYEARGEAGWRELRLTMEYLSEHYPDKFTIADAKRADIGSTNEGYVTAIFDELKFDAITLHPYLGREALRPFLDRADKTAIILCRTSNPGAGELQDLQIEGKPLWQKIAENVKNDWNEHKNCMLVVGATYPEEMAIIRQVVGDEITFLVPGIGAQGGDLEAVLRSGSTTSGGGLLVSSSREIIFAEDPSAAAKHLSNQIMAKL
jgi:orotidine-5'-phosphate decarboxylase